MKRKTLIGILVMCLLVGILPMSCGENSGLTITMPEKLPTGQKLVQTGGEEMLRENLGELFPHYTDCTVYLYSVNSTLSKYPPSIGETQVIGIYFESEEEAQVDHQNLFSVADYAMPISQFLTEYHELLEEYPDYLEAVQNLATDPEVLIMGDMDCIVFPVGDKLVLVYGDYCPIVAESIHSLNSMSASKSTATETQTPGGEVPTEDEEKGIPGFDATFAIAGLLAVAYMVLENKR